MKVLALSDRVIDAVYSPAIRQMFPDVGVVIGCGDLPYYYLEYVQDMLDVPVFFVRGNHAAKEEISEQGVRKAPRGAIDLHQRVVRYNGLILAGFEGSIRYRPAPYQYSQIDMWLMVLGIIPRLYFNRLFFGRYLDVLVTHSPPWKINDQEDRAHQGFKALRWFLRVFKPKFHIHGHVHIYDRNDCSEKEFVETLVVNACGYQKLEIDTSCLQVKEGEDG